MRCTLMRGREREKKEATQREGKKTKESPLAFHPPTPPYPPQLDPQHELPQLLVAAVPAVAVAVVAVGVAAVALVAGAAGAVVGAAVVGAAVDGAAVVGAAVVGAAVVGAAVVAVCKRRAELLPTDSTAAIASTLMAFDFMVLVLIC